MARTYGFFPSPESASLHMQRVSRLWAWFTTQQRRGGVFVPEPPGVPFYNDSGETIPPHAVMQITDGDESIVKVEKPIDSYGANGPYLINSEESVSAAKYGFADGIGPRLGKTNGGTFAFGKRMSAAVGQWYVIENPCGPWKYLSTAEPVSYAGDFVVVNWVGYPPVIDFIAPVGGIAAASGTTTITFGSAVCDIWADDYTVGDIIDSGSNETIYNPFIEAVGASVRGLAALSGRGIWRAISWNRDCPVTDIRLSGNNYQQKRCGTWETWLTGTECPTEP